MAYTPPGQTRERIYRFVRDRLLAGEPPSLREIMKEFGFTAVETVRAHLRALVEAGRLVQSPGEARGYRLPDGARPALVPVLGRVQAGELTTALTDPDGYVSVDAPAVRDPGEIFALRVRGESMIGANILPDDVVIVRQQPTAEHGDIVVAHIEGEATVKRLRFVQDADGTMCAELHAENPDFAPIVPGPSDELELFGKVIEVRRYLEETPPWVSS